MGSGEEEVETRSCGDTDPLSSWVMLLLENALSCIMGKSLKGPKRGGLEVSEEATKWSDKMAGVDGLGETYLQEVDHRPCWGVGLRERGG